jgi:predicted NAD-dependent protein-ADP-ribosyltransferase YbiA (DUF1768 family)
MIDIRSGYPFPGGDLSNFVHEPFKLDGIKCESSEGFLQSLKTADLTLSAFLRSQHGYQAKKLGTPILWNRDLSKDPVLFWNSREYHRLSDDYLDLLYRSYEARFLQNEGFRKALKATGSEKLSHACGSSDPLRTVITEREMCDALEHLRSVHFSKIFKF